MTLGGRRFGLHSLRYTAVLLSLCVVAAAEQTPAGVLVLDTERLSILAGGNLEYPCVAEVTLRMIPRGTGGTVVLTLEGDRALGGRFVPALLSASRVTIAGEPVVVSVVSGDAPGKLQLKAECAGQTLVKEFEVTSRWEEVPVIADALPRPPVDIVPEISERARVVAKELYDPRVSVRTEAKKTLVSLGEASIAPLLGIITDAEAPWDVRSLAVRTLAGIRSKQSFIALSRALKHPSPYVRSAAASGLKNTEDSKVIEAVAEALGNPDPRVRSTAIEVAVTVPGLREKVTATLDDPDSFVRARTAWELASSGDAALQQLLNVAEPARGLFDPDDFVRAFALRALVLSGAQRLYAGIIAALAHPSGHIRAQAVFAAAPVWNEKLTGLVLVDEDPYVERAAARVAASVLEERPALVFLRRLYQAKDAEARRIACRAVTQRGAFEDLERLVALLDEIEFRDEAVAALRQLTAVDFGYPEAESRQQKEQAAEQWKQWWSENKGKSNEEIWKAAMVSRGSRLRGNAAELLVRGGFKVDPVALEALTLDKHPANRILAASALFRTGRIKKAVDVMLGETRSDNWSARRLTIQSAAALAHPGAFPVLIAALDDPEGSLRKLAWQSLSSLVDEPLVFDPQAPAGRRQAAIHYIQEWFKRAYPRYYEETW